MAIGRREFIQRSVLGAGLGLLGGTATRAAAQSASKTQEPFAFCVVADTHCSEGPREGFEKYGTGVDRFLACVKAMEALEGAERPDFMLICGDIHPWALKEHIDKVTIPVHAVAGNHEASKERRKELRDLWPDDFVKDGKESDYYSFVHKGVRFIGLCDAGSGGDHVGHFCSEIIKPAGQCEWLEDRLAEPEPRKIVFAHIPPERDGKDRNMYLSRNDSRWFMDVVKDRKPEAMFFGHLHGQTEEYRIGDTRCFNMRSCCWNFASGPIGFGVVRVTEDGLVMREIETGRKG
jgi:predicted phosphodiesterase